jgi:hypothetical protein
MGVIIVCGNRSNMGIDTVTLFVDAMFSLEVCSG